MPGQIRMFLVEGKLVGCWHGPFLTERVLVRFSKKKKIYT